MTLTGGITDPHARIRALDGAALGPDRDAAIMHALEDRTSLVREHAIALAARYISPEILGELVGDHENAILRNSALTALERQGPYAVPHLLGLALDPDLEVAMFAVQVLSRIKDPSTIHALLPLMEHSDPNIAQAAVEALGNVKAREAVPGLIRLLTADMWVQFAVVSALGEIGDARAVGPLLECLNDELINESVAEALGKVGASDALPRLLEFLADTDRLPLRDHVLLAISSIVERNHVRSQVAAKLHRKLGEEGDRCGLIEYLSGLLSSDNSGLGRAAATLAVAAQLSKLYPAVLLRTVDSEELRWTIGLCDRFRKGMAMAQSELLSHPDPRVRRGALLTGSFSEASRELLCELLSDTDPHVRAAACLGLGHVGDVRAVPNLVERLMGGDAEERVAAAEALGRMPGESLAPLAPCLDRHGEIEPTIAALGILEAARSSLFEGRVVELLGSEHAAVRRAALRAIAASASSSEDHLVRHLDDPEESVRIEVVEMIVRRKSTKALPSLIAMLELEDHLRYHVIRGLGRLHATDAGRPLEALFSRAQAYERIEIVAALIRIGAPGLLSFLKQRLSEADTEIRRVAADGLARVATREELPLLVSLALDPDWNIRNHAAWGLGRLRLPEGRDTLLVLARDLEPVVARTARSALSKLPPA